MTLERLFALAVCVLICGAAANADIATISQTLDYTDNGGGHTWYFWNPEIIVDHSPFHRHAWEDWGWTHDVQGLAPQDPLGIDAATLSILAWGVDDYIGETDIIYANGVQLGTLEGPGNGEPVPPLPPEMYEVDGQPTGAFTQWSVTSFALPANVLQGLLLDGNLNVFLNIDAPLDGHRVTIASSTLTVNYITSNAVPEPATLAVLGLGGLFVLRRRERRS
jgi:hypothetical protein